MPAAWALVRGYRRRPVAYPHTLDILLTLPFLIDTAGNAANLYDTIGWWDDLNHFVNWALLVAAFGQLLLRLPVRSVAAVAISIGFGAVMAILWEIAEYPAFIHASSELATAYTDTLGDLALGLTGSVVAAAATYALTGLTIAYSRRRPSSPLSSPPTKTRAAVRSEWLAPKAITSGSPSAS